MTSVYKNPKISEHHIKTKYYEQDCRQRTNGNIHNRGDIIRRIYTEL